MVEIVSNHINQFLNSCLPSNKWELQLVQKWPTIIGDLQQHVHIEKMLGDTIILGVYDSSWLQELYMLSPLLLKNINKHLINHTIHNLRFKQTIKKYTKRKEKSFHSNQTEKPAKLSMHHEKVLTKIADDDLKTSLIRYLARCQRTE